MSEPDKKPSQKIDWGHAFMAAGAVLFAIKGLEEAISEFAKAFVNEESKPTPKPYSSPPRSDDEDDSDNQPNNPYSPKPKL